MARLRDTVVDSAHPASPARYWAAALDGYAVAPYDEAELARLRGLGIAGPEDNPTVLPEPRDGGPRPWVQLVPEPKRVKNRVHLDLSAPDLATEVDRLTELGATLLVRYDGRVVLRDPEGDEFRVTSGA
ncbi:VOC family protein [Streptomyces turgidiscabies]|uniref:Glyoxalase-like domain-containing protein n=1 Tax=Streptomyces turgidiscabies (strain Car8) TaxID=698760 RepID=L7FA25_STRT8|nr:MULTISPECIES: VOC family protein [Streptomyces]ELP67974.1 hypothetical protein STRTUCAR8_06990 [Streptomyces turgidiscabies Car8]MDX3497891.1 VOC family protein [Streptomyces turgidiscabies]GAQ69798.1 hypothetical protein T45_01529 [Streptomyces turgidiscabies]